MTAPLDIGMEQTDTALSLGHEDVFDLDNAATAMMRKGGAARLAEEDDAESDEDHADDEDAEDEDAIFDADEEEERRVAGLEAQLDGLYDAYRDHLRDRDAKYKVQEARRSAKHREEWDGIKDKGSADDSDGESDEEGGWDKFEAAKERAGEDSSEDEDSSDEDAEMASRAHAKKRRIAEDAPSEARNRKKARLADPPSAAGPLSRAAQVWFSQDCFARADIDVPDEEDAEDEEGESDEDGDAVSDGDVPMEVGARYIYRSSFADTSGQSSEDDFEVVPQEPDGADAEMWDVEDENLDEIKRAHVKSKSFMRKCRSINSS